MYIALVDDNTQHLQSLIDAVESLNHQPIPFSRAAEALAHCQENDIPLIISDIRMPEMDGLAFLEALKADERTRRSDVVLVTGQGDMNSAIQALRHGAYDYLNKPLHLEEIEAVVEKAAEHQQLIRENAELLERFDERLGRATEAIAADLAKAKQALRDRSGLGGIVAASPVMQQLVDQCDLYHQNPDVPVIIEGETGSGKEVMARLIHHGSDVNEEPFVDINCSALNATLFEGELFGYEKGAFTGGDPEGRAGKLELAGEGTLFLDEIGDMPVELQPKLLRVLQERTFYRVGGLKKLSFRARVICATNRDLEAMMAEGTFREDLYHRLRLGHLQIPPLRDRPEDILPLASRFLTTAAQRRGVPEPAMAPEFKQAVQSHPWPGNVRELQNAIDRAVLLARGGAISPELLGIGPGQPMAAAVLTAPGSPDLPEHALNLEEHINDLVRKALAMHDGNKSQTARYLGLSWAALDRRLKKMGG